MLPNNAFHKNFMGNSLLSSIRLLFILLFIFSLRKMSHLDISGVNDPESIPRGQRICLYPKFDPQDENDPVKADIGLVILEEPLYGEEIPISQSSNISLKSCSKCQYRSCEVYEYQSK